MVKEVHAMNVTFRNLTAEEIDVRIGSINAYGVSLLLYKDARVDMTLLDETVGPLNWKREHQSIDGKLYCIVSIKNPETDEWISKMDVGTESYTEKEKGECSDSFKRCCVNWGIGRELYSAQNIFFYSNQLKSHKQDNGKWKCYDTFSVTDIQYDDKNNIACVTIRNNANGFEVIFGTPPVAVVPPVNSAASAPAQNNSSTKKKRTPIEGSANEALSDADIRARKKIGKPQIDNLHKMGDELIDFDKLLSICKLSSLDQMTFRVYDNILENWDKVVYECSFLF